MMMKLTFGGLLAVLAIGLAACGTTQAATTHHTSAANGNSLVTDPNGDTCPKLVGGYCPGDELAPSASAAAAASQSAAAAACATQLQQWLSTSTNGDSLITNGQAITNTMFDANAYNQFYGTSAGSVADGGGQNFLTILGENVGDLTVAIPSCADSGGVWSSWVSDATNLSTDTPGTAEATGDYQALVSDYSTLKSEIEANGGTP
jgi:hypothetical protein